MTCKRCHGLLVQDQCYDLLDDSFSLRAWRCISCGNLIDSVILKNQQEQEARLATPRQVTRLVGASAA
jgi:hypothetical protein